MSLSLSRIVHCLIQLKHVQLILPEWLMYVSYGVGSPVALPHPPPPIEKSSANQFIISTIICLIRWQHSLKDGMRDQYRYRTQD
jgi:hypothetical protein